MVIYSIVRHYPEVGVHSAYPNSTDAMKALKRLCNMMNGKMFWDGWEFSVSLEGKDVKCFEIEENYLFGLPDQKE